MCNLMKFRLWNFKEVGPKKKAFAKKNEIIVGICFVNTYNE